MSLEVLALGVISGLRPATSQAAVVALLRTPDPRRTLLFFVVAGFTMSMAIGLLCVLAFHGARVNLGGSTFTAVFDLVAGAWPSRSRSATARAGSACRAANRAAIDPRGPPRGWRGGSATRRSGRPPWPVSRPISRASSTSSR